MTNQTATAAFPPEVEGFHAAMRRLSAVTNVTTGLKLLSNFTLQTYSLPGEFGDLPHALLRRSDGGLKDEVWASTEFTLAATDTGWLTLEFLSWWVRDLSRSGEQIQLRSMALPPRAYELQLGHTLKFIIDHFFICGDGTPRAALDGMHSRAVSLNSNIDNYRADLKALSVL